MKFFRNLIIAGSLFGGAAFINDFVASAPDCEVHLDSVETVHHDCSHRHGGSSNPLFLLSGLFILAGSLGGAVSCFNEQEIRRQQIEKLG